MPEPKKRPISKQEEAFLNRLRGIEAGTDASAQSLEALAKPIEQDLADRETGAIRFNFQYPSVDDPAVDRLARKNILDTAFDKEGAARFGKAGFDVATTLAMLSGSGTIPAMGLRAAAKEGIIPLVKAAVGKTLGGMSSAPARGAFAAASGLTGYDEPVEDFGGEVRNVLGLVAAKANPLAKFLAPTGSYARDAFRVTYPIAENLGIHYAGKPFEGSGEVFDGTSIGIGPALVGGLQSGMNLLSGNAFRVNQRLPRTVGPQAIEKLQAMVEGGQISPEEARKLASTVRDTAEAQLADTNVPGMFREPRDLNFGDFARRDFAQIAKMPTRTKEEVEARAAASRQLLDRWERLTNPDLSARTQALKKLQLGAVDPELEQMLDPERAYAIARTKGTPLTVAIDKQGMLQYGPTGSGFEPTGPGTRRVVGEMTTPPVMKMKDLKGPLSSEEAAARAVNQTYSWVNSAKHSEVYRGVIKDVVTNFRRVNPGTLDEDALSALKTLRSTENATEFSQNITKPKNLVAFNKYFGDDPRIQALAKRQFITEFINDINKYNGPKPGSGEKVTGTILDKLNDLEPEQVNKLFGNNDKAYQALKDISESFQEAHKYLTDKGMRLEAKSLTFPMIWLGFMAGKQMAMDSSMIAPAAYGITGLALAGNEIMALRPAMLERLLEHNGAGARILKEAWKNPEKNGRYLRLVSALITDNLDKTQKDPQAQGPGQ